MWQYKKLLHFVLQLIVANYTFTCAFYAATAEAFHVRLYIFQDIWLNPWHSDWQSVAQWLTIHGTVTVQGTVTDSPRHSDWQFLLAPTSIFSGYSALRLAVSELLLYLPTESRQTRVCSEVTGLNLRGLPHLLQQCSQTDQDDRLLPNSTLDMHDYVLRSIQNVLGSKPAIAANLQRKMTI